MRTNAAAVLTVAESVEKLRMEEGGISSPEEAASLSVALYGAPPKPSAGDVASLLAPPCKRQRLEVEDKSLADDVVLKMSVARYALENNRKRAETAAENISRIMEEITKTSPVDTLFIGLNNDNTPCVDCSKYKLSGEDKQISVVSFQKTAVIDSVEQQLAELLSKVKDPRGGGANNLRHYISVLANNASMNTFVAWADKIETTLKEYERLQKTSSVVSSGALVSRHAAKVKLAVTDIMKLVGRAYCKTVTQLITAQDISTFQKATDICYNALMAETHERIVSHLLFYVNFKTVEGNKKDYVKKRLGSMAGMEKEPLFIERREASEALFCLCFMFKIMPPEFVDCVLTFPSADLSYHGRSGTRVVPLLNNYGHRFEETWSLFKEVLSERSRVIRGNLSRIDCVDATANLTGSVYVLVSDVAYTFLQQRACAYNFFNDLKELYGLWNKFAQS